MNIKKLFVILGMIVTLSVFSAQNIYALNNTSSANGLGLVCLNKVTNNKTKTVFINKNNPQDNIPFNMVNMLPGDSETKRYNVEVSYSDDIVLKFETHIHEGYEKMAEVLKCKIVVNDEMIYDGLMKDMLESYDLLLKTDKYISKEIAYEVTTYLETSVGNEYQNKELYADFRWYVDGEEHLEEPPLTHDLMTYIPFASLAAVSLVAIVVLLGKRKENNNE